MRARHLACAALAVVLVTAGVASAQPDTTEPARNILEQQRRIDEQLAEQRAAVDPVDAFLDWRWGGWIEYYAFHFDDGVQASRLYQRPGLALWTRLRMDGGTHEVFARMRMTYEYFEPGDEYERQNDLIGPNLERLWYKVDIGRALKLLEPSDPYQLTMTIGRQQMLFGTGFVLDTPLDAILLDKHVYDFRFRTLIGRTFGLTPNIDTSPRVADDNERCFLGMEASYSGIERHELFAYGLWNIDNSDERPPHLFQDFAYDTQYWGVGARGELIHNLRYWAEGVFETGKSYGDGQWLYRDDVNAWGMDAGLEYLWDVRTRPRVAVEYMFGSGDPDRIDSPTNAAGGNRQGLDRGFNAYGYRDTGISASPAISNMHVLRFGGSLLPFEDKVEALRNLELGTNWFLYHKNHAIAAISDPTADLRSGNVGWEMDYYLNWRMTSDLSWTVRWGAFFPGEAYSDRGTRHFVFTGVTWSF